MGKENEDGTKKRRRSISGSSGTSMKEGDMYKVYKYLFFLILKRKLYSVNNIFYV